MEKLLGCRLGRRLSVFALVICPSGFPYDRPTIFVLPNTPPNEEAKRSTVITKFPRMH